MGITENQTMVKGKIVYLPWSKDESIKVCTAIYLFRPEKRLIGSGRKAKQFDDETLLIIVVFWEKNCLKMIFGNKMKLFSWKKLKYSKYNIVQVIFCFKLSNRWFRIFLQYYLHLYKCKSNRILLKDCCYSWLKYICSKSRNKQLRCI